MLAIGRKNASDRKWLCTMQTICAADHPVEFPSRRVLSSPIEFEGKASAQCQCSAKGRRASSSGVFLDIKIRIISLLGQSTEALQAIRVIEPIYPRCCPNSFDQPCRHSIKPLTQLTVSRLSAEYSVDHAHFMISILRERGASSTAKRSTNYYVNTDAICIVRSMPYVRNSITHLSQDAVKSLAMPSFSLRWTIAICSSGPSKHTCFNSRSL